MNKLIRNRAEQEYLFEIEEIIKQDTDIKPPNWKMSPQSVMTYILGGKLKNGFEISPKYIGNKNIVEVSIATLLTDRALFLIGLPGTAKSWLSEHLAAAISGKSNLILQGTAGTIEESIRYNWNYALLLSEGPSEKALVPSPVMVGMKEGKVVRIEELTRISPDVQDSLITILSEKSISIPELGNDIQAIEGFNIIATSNDRDKGINELSSALKRRFNTVILPVPDSIEDEVKIVKSRISNISKNIEISLEKKALEEIRKVITIFREFRNGYTADNSIRIKIPSSTLSTAEAISTINNSIALSVCFGNGEISSKEISKSLIGTIVKESNHDKNILIEYNENVIKNRVGWNDLYNDLKELL